MFGTHDNDSGSGRFDDQSANNIDGSSQGDSQGAPMAPQASTPVVDEPSTADSTYSDAGDTPDAVGDATVNDLADIKQQALKQLTPLVGRLDQSPEEKFRTTMMMIQAADDKSLIKQAYEAAEAISDEKEKAQALLDIVNEINYFSQQQTN